MARHGDRGQRSTGRRRGLRAGRGDRAAPARPGRGADDRRRQRGEGRRRWPTSWASRFVACDVREEDQVQAAVEAAGGGRGRPAHLRLLRRHGMGAEGRGLARAPSAGALRGHRRHQPDRHLQRAAARLQRDAGQRAARGRRARRVRQHRVDRGLRRPGRPGRLQRVEGRRRRHDPARGPRPRFGGHPRRHHRSRPLRHPAAGRAPARGARVAGQVDPVAAAPRPARPSTRSSRRTSSRTGCSTARSSGSTGRCAWLRADPPGPAGAGRADHMGKATCPPRTSSRSAASSG